MAELPDDEQPGQDPQTNRDPLWNTLQDLAPEGPAHEAMSQIVTGLNDYQKKTELVAANEAAGENFVNDLSDWKSGMEAAVKNDPLFVHTAMDVTVPFINGTAGQIDPEHADTLIRGMHHDLSTLSVYTAAEQNGDLARSLLGNERIRSNLSEEEQGALGRYIGFQDDARARDRVGQEKVAQAQADNYRDQTAMKYMQALSEFLPPNFHSEVLADTTLTPSMKGALGDMATKILRDGPNEYSDPFALEDLTRRAARGERVPVEDFMAAVTNGEMRLEDARHVAMTTDRKEAGALLQHLTSAREYLMGADGENGAAGAQAYKNFTNFFMNQFNAVGTPGLDPRGDQWIMRSVNGKQNYASQILNSFRPNGDDLIFDSAYPSAVNTAEARPLNSLENIFGKNKPSGDPVLYPRREPGYRPEDYIDLNSDMRNNRPKRS